LCFIIRYGPSHGNHRNDIHITITSQREERHVLQTLCVLPLVADKGIRRKNMAMTQDLLAIGIFRDPTQARRAIDELKHAGYSDQEIGYLTRVGTEEVANDVVGSAATGAIGGGILGGLLGAAASLLIPGIGPFVAGGILAATLGTAGVGALAGSLIGILTSMGVPEEEARFYQRELEAGHTIVTVKSTSGYNDALAILRRNGAYDATTRPAVFNAEPPIRPFGPDTTPEETDITENMNIEPPPQNERQER
jgi:hypothetical protein